MSEVAEKTVFRATWLAEETLRDLREGVRYIWHEGGSRSSKTYSIAVAILFYVFEHDATVDIVRLSNPAVKGSVLIDLIDVAESLGLYDPALHTKTEQVMRLVGGRGRIRYYGVEDEQKIRGWKRDILWMNEANEISDEKRRQLWIRTGGSILLDHNPTVDDAHWIVKILEPKIAEGECRRYHSTYKDNLPFLEEKIIREIEGMQYDDPWGWTVYGLGKRGSNPGAVFTDVAYGKFDPQGDTVIGVDFGMKDPFVVCEWGWRDSNPPAVPKATLYCRPWLYASNMTTGEAIERLKDRKMPNLPMYCDHESDRIKELQQAGFDAIAVEKPTGAREAGYDWMKRHRIVVDSEMMEAEAVYGELKRTRHKKKPGLDEYTDRVVDADDHVADSGRYGAFTKFGRVQSMAGLRLMYI